MSEKQDRQGVRTAADIERKWQFGEQFAKILGIATDAQNSVSRVESTLRDDILAQSTSLTRTAEEIVQAALKTYVETEDLNEFKKTLETEFKVWAGGISGRVSDTEEAIRNVNEDLQGKINTITKYFTFDINGLTIGQVDNPNKVIIDNDEVTIMVNDDIVQTFKADGSALIPTLKISKLVNMVGLQISEDITHINCDYVGGV